MSRDILLSLKFPDRSNAFKKYTEDQRDRGLINPSAFGNRDLAFVPVINVIRSVMPSNDVLPKLGPDDSGFRDNIDANKQILDLLEGLGPMHRYYDDDDISLDPRLDKVINGSNAVRERHMIHEKEKKGKNSVNLVKQGNISFMREQGLYDSPEERKAKTQADAEERKKEAEADQIHEGISNLANLAVSAYQSAQEPASTSAAPAAPTAPAAPAAPAAQPRANIPVTDEIVSKMKIVTDKLKVTDLDPKTRSHIDNLNKRVKNKKPITQTEYDFLNKHSHDEL